MDLNASSKKTAAPPAEEPRAKLWGRLRLTPIIKDTLGVSALSIIGRSIGFVIPFVIAALYGLGGETDAFFFAYGAIFFLTSIFAGVVSSVIVPFVAEARVNGEDLGKFIGSILTALTCVVLLAGLAFIGVSYPVFKVATGFSQEQLTLVYCLFLETLPIALLVLWSNLLGGVLNAHHRFSQPQISLASRSLVTILIIAALKNSLGVHAIPAAYFIGEAVRTIVLFVSLSRAEGLTIRFSSPNKASFDFFKTASIQILGVTVLSFNPMVNKAMASWLAEGSVSLLEYAYKLFFIPANILGEGLFIVVLSHWSTQKYRGGMAGLRADVVRTTAWISLLAAVLGLGFFVLRHEFTALFYGWGSFPKAKLPELGEVFGMYILGLPAHLAGTILLIALIVLKDTRSIAKIAVLKGLLNVLCNYVLLLLIGLKGIALSTSLVEYLGALGLYLYFCKTFEVKRDEL